MTSGKSMENLRKFDQMSQDVSEVQLAMPQKVHYLDLNKSQVLKSRRIGSARKSGSKTDRSVSRNYTSRGAPLEDKPKIPKPLKNSLSGYQSPSLCSKRLIELSNVISPPLPLNANYISIATSGGGLSSHRAVPMS